MATHPPHLDKYVKLFQQQMTEVDELQQVVLKGHLIIESALDSIITIIFHHPEHIFRGRFGFVHKVNLARAYGLRKDTNSMWNLVLSVNETRNEIAHNLAGEKRTKKMVQLRRMFLSESDGELRKEFEKQGQKLDDASDEVIAFYACSMCTEFLGTFEHDIEALRHIIDVMDHGMHPDHERVPVKSADVAKKRGR
jgi:hypothetical protein